jgi:hypothetical protein
MSFCAQYFIRDKVYTYVASSFDQYSLVDVTQRMHHPIYPCNIITETESAIVNSFLQFIVTLYLVSNPYLEPLHSLFG